jgi:S1-C subfamily serine protease
MIDTVRVVGMGRAGGSASGSPLPMSHGSCAVGLEERDGLLVRDVKDDSPAAKAGIAEGDLIVAAASKPVASADDLFEAMGSLAADAALPLTILRGAEERTVTVAA